MNKKDIFVRRRELDDAFDDMHKIKPMVSINVIDSSKYKVKLDHKGKQAIITEVLKRGLTESATLEIDGRIFSCKSVFEAEKLASEILDGKKDSDGKDPKPIEPEPKPVEQPIEITPVDPGAEDK